MATNRIVSKQELEDSGLSLRDFLNRERGLTRKPDAGIKFGVNKQRGPSSNDLAAFKAQELANQGLDENGSPLNYVRRDMYTDSGKDMVDKQDAIAKLDALNAANTTRFKGAGAGRGVQGGPSNMDLDRQNAGTQGYDEAGNAMKRGGRVKKMAKGGVTSSASSRADGIASRGKTRGRFV
jgi:hypothetical protein